MSTETPFLPSAGSDSVDVNIYNTIQTIFINPGLTALCNAHLTASFIFNSGEYSTLVLSRWNRRNRIWNLFV